MDYDKLVNPPLIDLGEDDLCLSMADPERARLLALWNNGDKDEVRRFLAQREAAAKLDREIMDEMIRDHGSIRKAVFGV